LLTECIINLVLELAQQHAEIKQPHYVKVIKICSGLKETNYVNTFAKPEKNSVTSCYSKDTIADGLFETFAIQ